MRPRKHARKDDGEGMGDTRPVLMIASALIRRGTDVLLVRQRRRETGQDYWSLPGGVVDPGELLSEAMIREVREECGLEVLDPGRLLYVVQHDKPAYVGPMLDFCFEVAAWRGDVAHLDPDEILEARFLPLDNAIANLRGAGGADWYEPVTAYLQGGVEAGTLWLYRQQPDGRSDLVGRVLSGDRAW